jgi:hypothetical protein
MLYHYGHDEKPRLISQEMLLVSRILGLMLEGFLENLQGGYLQPVYG